MIHGHGRGGKCAAVIVGRISARVHRPARRLGRARSARWPSWPAPCSSSSRDTEVGQAWAPVPPRCAGRTRQRVATLPHRAVWPTAVTTTRKEDARSSAASGRGWRHDAWTTERIAKGNAGDSGETKEPGHGKQAEKGDQRRQTMGTSSGPAHTRADQHNMRKARRIARLAATEGHDDRRGGNTGDRVTWRSRYAGSTVRAQHGMRPAEGDHVVRRPGCISTRPCLTWCVVQRERSV